MSPIGLIRHSAEEVSHFGAIGHLIVTVLKSVSFCGSRSPMRALTPDCGLLLAVPSSPRHVLFKDKQEPIGKKRYATLADADFDWAHSGGIG
jgi:hypothetical protein